MHLFFLLLLSGQNKSPGDDVLSSFCVRFVIYLNFKWRICSKASFGITEFGAKIIDDAQSLTYFLIYMVVFVAH